MKGHEVALWSGVCSFFGSLISHGLFDEVHVDQWLQYFITAVIIGFIVTGALYAKDKLDEAKKKRDAERNMVSNELGKEKED